MQGKGSTIKARAIIPIFFSTVTNTSKKIAYMLQDKLQSQSFLVTVTNIGDIDYENFLQLAGPAVFLISTYGNGGSPVDGEDFMEWLKTLEPKKKFEHMQFAILGLGNKSFQHFCGNSKTLRQLLLKNDAKEIFELCCCNSSSTDETAYVKFPQWSTQLIEKLKAKHEIKQLNVGELLQNYKATSIQEQIDQTQWEKQYGVWHSKLGKQFLAYHKSHKSKVIHIKQLRQKDDGRSTLWLRITIPQGLKIQPACNVSVYPQNVRKQGEPTLKGSIKIQAIKKNAKIAYPPMPLERLWKLSNFNQIADLNIIKYAVAVSEAPQQAKQKYIRYLKNPELVEQQPIRCQQLYQKLNPGIDFIVKIGMNTVRPYTLASWEPEKGYFDLVASIDPLGLTSKFFQSNPATLRLLPTTSSFYVPSGRPIVMIANGSGIAPFRSLTQYFLNHETEMPKLYLYFGIQSRDCDYYFKDEWEKLGQQGKIVLKIAQSRADPNKKVYVQDLIRQDRVFFKEHLFENKGVIFICGGKAMSNAVDSQLFQSIKLHQKIPFKAFKLSTQLIKNKTIVKEVFH